MSGTLAIYITRRFALWVIAMLGALTLLFSMFDFIELLRRAVSRPAATLDILAEIAVLHLPYMALQLLPFAVLLGGMGCFWRLNRTSELVVMRAAGLSAWQFLAAPVAAAALIGAIATFGGSPISSVCYDLATRLDNQYIRDDSGVVSLEDGEIWLRQDDFGLRPGGSAIVHGLSVRMAHGDLNAAATSVFRLDPRDEMIERVEATSATLGKGIWRFQNARIIRPDQLPVAAPGFTLPTDLTVAKVEQSFSSPDTLSVWALPGFIAQLEKAGFSSVRHRLHLQTLLALPLLAGTMALVAAGFSMRPARRGGAMQTLSSGVAAGFALYAFSRFAAEFGQSGALPAALAAWAPAAVGLFLSVTLLLHLEDG